MEEQHYPYGDEIDLGKYIVTLFRQWQLILGATLLCAFAAGLFSVLTPKSYEATVLVASTKTTSTVSFGSAIQTLTEEQLATLKGQGVEVTDRKARLESFVQLVSNAAVAQKVLDQVGDKLDEDERNLADLLGMVSGELLKGSDTIAIKITYKDPVIAAEIANAWGREYVKQINAIYSSGGTVDAFQSIQSETAKAKNTYDIAQEKLVAFMASNPKDEINRKISELQTIINSLSTARSTAIETIVGDLTNSQLEVIKQYYQMANSNQLLALQRDREGRQHLITSYINTLNQARQEVFDQAAQDYITDLPRAYSDLRKVETQLRNANDLKKQVQEGGTPAATSNYLALTLLKANIYAGGIANLETIPDAFADNLAAVTADGVLYDLDALIGSLETRKASLQEEIQTLSDKLINGDGFAYLDAPLDSTGDLAATIQERYTELWDTGSLTDLSLKVISEGNAMEQEALSRAQSLLQLEGMNDILSFSIAKTPLELKVQDLEQQVRDLQAQLAEADDAQKELTRARDLAWETYTALATKSTELSVAAQTTGVEVALASPAAVPNKDTVSGAKNTAMAAVVGLMLGIGAAYLTEFWWSYNKLEPEPVKLITWPIEWIFKRGIKNPS